MNSAMGTFLAYTTDRVTGNYCDLAELEFMHVR